MTFGEAMQDAFKITNEEFDTFFQAQQLLRTFAALYIYSADNCLKQSFPNVDMAGEKYPGKKIEKPEVHDYISLIVGDGFGAREMSFSFQVIGFFTWLIDEEIPEEEEDEEGNWKPWYSLAIIGGKWNEYAEKEKGGKIR